MALERQINSETTWGRRVVSWLEELGTKYVTDHAFPGQMRYRITDDTISFNPGLDMTVDEKI